MIYFPDSNTCVLHIPRTGGTALKELCRTRVNCVIYEGSAELEHMPAYRAREMYPNARLIAVARSPWEIVRSMWQFAVSVSTNPDTDSWTRLMSFAGLVTFDVYVRHVVTVDFFYVRRFGGFWNLIASEDCHALHYSRNINCELLSYLGLGITCTPNPDSYDHTSYWTSQLIELIRQYCWHDIQHFGFQPPECKKMTSTGAL